ncbi:AMP-binding protein [Burkholderia contaminans]|uniref:acetate--CoA ligase n=4 Tax=Pseudomonadota TaxID=1224 RepID=A0AAP1VBZ5_9BURK|nr:MULTISPECIES: AMP-binding protein [Burkholderia]UTP27759.1 AMP-binding protein [Burkholderia sp. FXe9]MBA9834619.1 acetate--CoA ligase [Burkholderia contaminans]MBA9842453.1 acetate--CoA ligase [Burkholderia contaminans]MBA9867387.1 acetate--CoA ligase [Burkholderia contaminans]MBA9909944.1 acetate--CoA ligase [Burkholderia contaminans]
MMSNHESGQVWKPGQRELQHAGIVKLMHALGVPSYEELMRVSIAEPERYWTTVMDECAIAWDALPTGYADLSRGPQFPSWFPGGKLNWVNTIYGWARNPATAQQKAVVAEREDGSVSELTYAELEQRVSDFAAGLVRHGVRQGDRVGLLMENGVEATVSLLAIVHLGALVVPLFSGFGVDAIVARLSAAEARIVIASTGFSRRTKRVDVQGALRDAWRQLPLLEHVIWKRGEGDTAQDTRDLDWQETASAGQGQGVPPVSVTPDTPFMVIYTSGTTGKPKGVVHTHGSFPIKIAHDSLVHFDVHPGDVYCWPADMGWIAGTLVLGCALLRGATLVCYDGAPDYPDWSRMSRVVERHRVTHFGSAPTLIRGMASHEALALAGDRSTVRLLITAGEGIAPEHFNWFLQRFGDGTAPVINYTGGTEASGALLASVPIRPIPPSGFNTVSPGVAADVVNADGQSVTGEIGELAIRAPFVGMTQSFWHDDERYLETYWQTIPGIWVHGDLALRTSTGNYFMMGRSDDTLKVAGKRLGPAEVEEVVLELPDVAEAAAIGVADADKGQKLVVFVVPKPDADGTGADLEAIVSGHVDKRLGRPFRPGRVHVVAQLPKTRSSKIMRRVIRSVYCGQPPGDLSSLDNPGALDEVRAAATSA